MKQWEEYSIENLCTKVTDGAHFSPREVADGYPMASSKDMSDNDFDLSNVKKIAESDYLKLVNSDCKPLLGDILIIKDGNSYLKNIFAVKEERELVILSSIAILRPRKELILPAFFQYILRTPYIKKQMENYVSGAAIPRIVLKDFKQMKLSIPPLPTQQKIAAILSAYDDLIENNLRRIRLLEEAAQHLYREWFVRLRFPGWEDVPVVDGLPVGWERRRADEIFDISIGKTPPRNEPEWFVEGKAGVKWVSIRDMNASGAFLLETSEGITTEGVQKFNINVAPQGTVILSFKLTIGALAIVSEDMVTNEAIAHFKIPNGATVSNYFTYCYLKNFNYETLGSTSSIGTALNSKMVKAIPFVVPEQETSHLFDRTAETFFNQIKNLLLQNQRLKEARDLLLPRLMSGALAV